MLPGWSDNESRCAKALFGRALRLQLAEWIARRPDEPFFQTEAQIAMQQSHGAAQSAVREELQLFVEWGLLSRFDEDRKIYFAYASGPLWKALDAACLGVHAGQDTAAANVDPAG